MKGVRGSSFIDYQRLTLMSYENNQCVCGGRKERETMLCADCISHISQTPDARLLAGYKEASFRLEQRRSMAIRLLSVARRRNKALPLSYYA
jgi:hypothetical protein